MSKKRRALKIVLEAEKCLCRKGEITLSELVYEVSLRGSRYQVTTTQLAGLLRVHGRITKEDKYDKFSHNTRSMYRIKETS